MSPECFELSMEQQFNIRTIELNTLNLPPEQLQELFVEISRQLIVKDNVIRHLVKNSF
jgi:Phycobilisome degradation protein nblA